MRTAESLYPRSDRSARSSQARPSAGLRRAVANHNHQHQPQDFETLQPRVYSPRGLHRHHCHKIYSRRKTPSYTLSLTAHLRQTQTFHPNLLLTMSTFGGPGGRQIVSKPIPPQRGSFPLDHEAECQPIMKEYLKCLRQYRGMNDEVCRQLRKSYLKCRMER
jgi:cytochrome c oxidase assembly protein subunit 19